VPTITRKQVVALGEQAIQQTGLPEDREVRALRAVLATGTEFGRGGFGRCPMDQTVFGFNYNDATIRLGYAWDDVTRAAGLAAGLARGAYDPIRINPHTEA
jgi:hypothetical protein